MDSNDEIFAHPGHPAWTAEDVAFATSELAREFPEVAAMRILAAVNSATPFLPSTVGRVKLVQRARERLRAS